MFVYCIVANVRGEPQDPRGELSLYFFIFLECCFRRYVSGSVSVFERVTLNNICIISTSSFEMVQISRCGSYLACVI